MTHLLLYSLFTIYLKCTFSFFKLGCMPNITRNAIVNCAELVTYDIIKELILKYDLMTGKVRRNTRKTGLADDYKIPLKHVTCLPIRQPAVPLHCCLRRRLLHNSGGLSCGCGQNAVHEFRIWPVQQCDQLCPHYAEK